jgi:threonine/homoserine/homoserine lactone efflux protein
VLFPQFVPDDSSVLGATLLMGPMVVAFDVRWYGAVAYGVTRVKRAFVRTALARRIEQLTGAVLLGLGLRLAIEKG